MAQDPVVFAIVDALGHHGAVQVKQHAVQRAIVSSSLQSFEELTLRAS